MDVTAIARAAVLRTARLVSRRLRQAYIRQAGPKKSGTHFVSAAAVRATVAALSACRRSNHNASSAAAVIAASLCPSPAHSMMTTGFHQNAAKARVLAPTGATRKMMNAVTAVAARGITLPVRAAMDRLPTD